MTLNVVINGNWVEWIRGLHFCEIEEGKETGCTSKLSIGDGSEVSCFVNINSSQITCAIEDGIAHQASTYQVSFGRSTE